jgi:hypothetical protein
MEEIKKVRSFCKGTKIVGVSLSDLFDSISRKYPMTRGVFEVSMLKLNKKPALDLKEHCLEYFEAEGEHAYEKFCKEQGFVTEEFWAVVTGVKPSETAIRVSHSTDQGKWKTLMTESSTMTAIAPAKAVPTAWEAKNVLENPSSYLNRVEEIKKIIAPAPENEQEAMQRMLPVNWATMDFPNRVDFVKKIQHGKFRDFVLGVDSKLKKYFSVLKPKPPLKIKLYVTLFQFPADNYSTEAKNLLKSFVEILNTPPYFVTWVANAEILKPRIRGF